MMMASSVFSSLRQAAICDVEIGVRARAASSARRRAATSSSRNAAIALRRVSRSSRFIRLRKAVAQQRQRAACRAGDQEIGLEIAERILRLPADRARCG